eukprot:COSAG01_NODE_5160_length_4444_cov_3.051784_3_plen_107_part_00
MSSDIALGVAQHYEQLKLPVGVIVIDYKNQHHDGDWAPGPECFPSVKALSDGVKAAINATTVFSFCKEACTPVWLRWQHMFVKVNICSTNTCLTISCSRAGGQDSC